MRMNMFAVEDKVKPDIENKRLKLGGGQAYDRPCDQQPFQHKICKIGMICSAKPVLTEDLCVVQKQEFCSNMLYARKAKHIHNRQTHLLVREDVT
jgi:hypothetical protein